MSEAPYIVITADTHAGNSVAGYRDYLDPEFRSEFDDSVQSAVPGVVGQAPDQHSLSIGECFGEWPRRQVRCHRFDDVVENVS